jgi:hypothetical protein
MKTTSSMFGEGERDFGPHADDLEGLEGITQRSVASTTQPGHPQ